MKKRGLIICLAAIICLSGIGGRIWYINMDREDTVTEIYPMGEMVSFEDDYFYNSDELRDQYEVCANSAVVMPVKEYLDSVGLTEEEVWPDGNSLVTDILSVEVTIRNNNTDVENDNQYFDLFNTNIMSQGDNYQMEHDILWTMYPQLDQSTFGFRIAPGTEYTITLPFRVLNWQRTNSEKIKQKENYLLLSMYPVKKMIRIIPE